MFRSVTIHCYKTQSTHSEVSRSLDERTIRSTSEELAFSHERGDFGRKFQRRNVPCDNISFHSQSNRSVVGKGIKEFCLNP